MSFSTLRLFLLLSLTLPVTAQAKTYLWKDATGIHMTDNMPADAVKYGYKVIDSSGNVIDEVAPALTPEQVKEKEEKEKALKAQELAKAEAQQQKDNEKAGFLAKYSSLSVINEDREAELDAYNAEIDSLKKNYDSMTVKDQESTLVKIMNAPKHRQVINDKYDGIVKQWSEYQTN